MKKYIKKRLSKLPYIRTLILNNQRLERDLNRILSNYETWVPPGHYYSPIPDIKELENYRESIFNNKKNISNIDLNISYQIGLLHEFRFFYKDFDFQSLKNRKYRYYFDNPSFQEADAFFLYSFIRHFKPRKIIEIGSGYSSALMLDINEYFMNHSIDFTFIEPYPELFLSLLSLKDHNEINLIKEKIQDVDLELFSSLEKGDLLFIDSSHVSKTGSDINKIFFDLLPIVKKGVFIHFHDILFPFEYPEEWVFNKNGLWKGFAWNEVFLLRAFLMDNPHYRIEFFNNYILKKEKDFLLENMPICLSSNAGSIFLKKI